MTIFIDNLSLETEQDDLQDLFNTYGEVKNVQFLFNTYGEVKNVQFLFKRYTGRKRGFGFIELSIQSSE